MEQMPKRIILPFQTDMPLCDLKTCSVCGEAVERVMTQANRDFCDSVGLFPGIRVGEVFPFRCRCEKDKWEAEREIEQTQKAAHERADRLRQIGLIDPQYRDMTFLADQGYNPHVSTIARGYVDSFGECLPNNIGLLFTGDVGTGKTFFAASIVNALNEKGLSAIMTRLSRIINADFEEVDRLLRIIDLSDLVVFDDLGAERDTSFACERVFDAIDTRIRARKPIIVTTNLTPGELGGVTDKRLKRIYDRILGACTIVPVNGSSVRVIEHAQKTEFARGLLLGESEK